MIKLFWNNSNKKYKPFHYIRKVESEKLLIHLKNEHPQTIACVLSYLKPKKSAYILLNLPDDIQSEIIKRIAIMDKINSEMIREVERVLEKKLSCMSSECYETLDGIENAVDILKSFNTASSKVSLDKIFADIEKDDPELIKELKKRRK